MSNLDPWSIQTAGKGKKLVILSYELLFYIIICMLLDAIKKIEKHTGQKHCTVNHSKEHKTADGIHTNVVEGTNNALKCKLLLLVVSILLIIAYILFSILMC